MSTRAHPPLEQGSTIEVLLFAVLRERAGWERRRVPLSPGICAAQLWQALGLGAGDLPSTVRVAVNQAFADPLQPLAAGDELAFLPPISGG